MARRHIHLITPGDHFSPRTGSAIPTVVHGLAGTRSSDGPRPGVLVARGTYPDRYDSAEVLEYEPTPPRRTDRYLDPLAGVACVPRPGARRAFAAALRRQQEWPGAVVLAHNAPQAVPLVRGDRRAVLYVHNRLLSTYRTREVRRVLGPVAAIVCVSSHLAGETADALPPELSSRLAVVHNGVDPSLLALPRTARSGPLRVTYVGRVLADKGVHVLLEALDLLGRPDLLCTIVGRVGFSGTDPLTSYERRLRRDTVRLPCEVVFTSFLPRPDLMEVLGRTDVLVVPSVWPEPFGLTALEGMAAGAAVVASDVGGLPEAVGSAGVLVRPDDPHQLASVLGALADDEAELDRLRAAGRDRAQKMSWSKARARLEEVLKDV